MPEMFSKTVAQRKAIDKIANSEATNIMLFGGARAGKSAIAVYIVIVRACLTPNSNHIIVRNTFNAVKNSMFMETIPVILNGFFPDLPVKWDKTNYRIILPNESTIRVSGLDDQKRVESLLGLQFSTILVEECNQVAWVAVQRLKTRLAEKNNLVKKTFYTQNPTKTSSAYYQVFEQQIDPIDGEAFDPDTAKDYLSIKMNPLDNIENIDPNFLNMLEKLPEKEKLRFLSGEYDKDNSGAAVYSFNKEEHVSDIAKRLEGTDYVGSDFNIDWNSDVLASQHANGLYVWDEIQIAGDTFKKCDELKRKGVSGATVICDSTGKARRTSGKSDHVILKNAGFHVKFKTNPAVKDKIANLNRCFTLGLIKINPRCKKLIRDLTQLEWNDKEQLDQKTDPSLSHLVDSLAYLCWSLYPLSSNQTSNASFS